jgi:4'-phosphopantetheinyl transferase
MLDQRIHLYVGLIEDINLRSCIACFGTLSVAEKCRAERFMFERDRREFLVAHGLVRAALSRAVPEINPSDWVIISDEHGRPYVAGPTGVGVVHFSLSHTKGCVACAISPNEAIGIDVEESSPRDWLLEVAETSFSAKEVAALRALEPREQAKRFFECWTLKEAYIKARGKGLRIPLDCLSMEGVPEKNVRIAFAHGLDDDPTRWHFTQIAPSRRHKLAIADGSGVTGGIPIIFEPWPWA